MDWQTAYSTEDKVVMGAFLIGVILLLVVAWLAFGAMGFLAVLALLLIIPTMRR
jgi:hypothetical protein